MSSERNKRLIAAAEVAEISRKMTVWVNKFPETPVDFINFERLADPEKGEATSMALVTLPGAYINKQYILGGYQGVYTFKVVYRIKPGTSSDERLEAETLLNNFGDWAMSNMPDLGDGVRPLRVDVTTQAGKFAAYQNNYEDYQILLRLTYELTLPTAKAGGFSVL